MFCEKKTRKNQQQVYVEEQDVPAQNLLFTYTEKSYCLVIAFYLSSFHSIKI